MISIRKKIRAIKARKKEMIFPYRSYHRKHNCIFIHIPKVAGTSILKALGKKKGGRHHLTWYIFYTANPVYFNSAFKFAFVRNPWCRAFSAYRYLRNGGNQQGDLSISEKIKAYKNFDSFLVDGLGRGFFRSNYLFVPQSEFIVNGEDEIVVDFLGRFENLEEDYKYVSKRLSLNLRLPEENRSGISTDYQKAYLSQEAINVVGEIYKQDIIMFNYAF